MKKGTGNRKYQAAAGAFLGLNHISVFSMEADR